MSSVSTLRRLAVGLVLAIAAALPAQAMSYAIDSELENGLRGRLLSLVRAEADSLPALPPGLGPVRRRAEALADLLGKALIAEGYYAGTAAARVAGDADDPEVIFTVDPGPLFAIAGYRIDYADEDGGNRPNSLNAAGLQPQKSPRADDIARLGRGLIDFLHAHGYPAAFLVDRRVEADFEAATAVAVLRVRSGAEAVVGDLDIAGLERTRRDYVLALARLERGAPLSLPALAAYRDRLIETELFSSVEVEPGVTGPDGATPILVRVTERRPRTLSAGVSYSTNLGPGIEAGWVHRNWRGGAERLSSELAIAAVTQTLMLGYGIPLPAWQARLGGEIELEREDSDAFESRSLVAGAALSGRLAPSLRGSLGAEIEAADTDDPLAAGTSYLLAMPAVLRLDTADDLLDPRRGARAEIRFTPHIGASDDEPIAFGRTELRGTLYQPLDGDARFVAAGWARLGVVLGTDLEQLPARKRFYAGGSGSVRGYGYQLIGPRDENLDPTGGRSVVDGGVELRARMFNNIGLVLFAEGGNVSTNVVPDFDGRTLFGVGTGLRYHSPIGPVRIDIAVPLDRRDGDDAFQFYLSLGQAF